MNGSASTLWRQRQRPPAFGRHRAGPAAKRAPAPSREGSAPTHPRGMTAREVRAHAGRPPVSTLLVIGFFLVVFLACFASVLVADYGFWDDYGLLRLADEPYARVEEMVREGRPINALVWWLSLQAVTDVEHLRYVRLAGVLGIAALAWGVFRALAYAGWSRFQSACVAVIACTSLPFQVYAAWASCAPYLLAALAAGLAFALGERAFKTPRRRSRWLAAAGAGLALLAAFAVYQPAAMFFWVFAAAVLLKPDTDPREVTCRFGGYCAIALAAMLGGFALYRLGLILVPGDFVRTGLVQDLPTKAVWFLSIYLPNAVNFFLPSPSHLLMPEAGGDLSIDLYHRLSDALHRLNVPLLPPYGQAGPGFPHAVTFLSAAGEISFVHKVLDALIAWGALAVIGVGLWRCFRGERGDRLRKIAIAAALLLLSSVPNLVVEENISGYRSMPALAALVVLFAYLAFRGYGGRAAATGRAHALLGLAAVACALSAAWHVHACFVAPQVRELALMRSALESGDLSRVRGIHVLIPPKWRRNPPAPLLWREFGAASSAGESARDMAILLQRKIAPEHASAPIVLVDFNDPSPPPPDVLVVDMRRTGG